LIFNSSFNTFNWVFEWSIFWTTIWRNNTCIIIKAHAYLGHINGVTPLHKSTEGTNKCITENDSDTADDCPKDTIPNNCGMDAIFQPDSSDTCKEISLVQGYCCCAKEDIEVKEMELKEGDYFTKFYIDFS